MVVEAISTEENELEGGHSDNDGSELDENKSDVSSVLSSDLGYCNSLDVFDANSRKLQFGNVAVTDSSDVHFGDKNYYQGPVTIKQILYNASQLEQICTDTAQSIDGCERNEKGKDNPCFSSEVQNGLPNSDVNKNCFNNLKKTKNENKHWLKLKSNKFIIMLVLTVVFSCIIISLTAVLAKLAVPNRINELPEDGEEQEIGTPIETPVDPQVGLTLSGKLKIISRMEWVAQPPTDAATPLQLPVPYVIIMHTATENCSDQAACTFHVRFIQTFHIESRHWFDIGYNFLVGGDGFAYEGRGYKSEGAHTYGYNARSIGIAFIGTFNDILPPKRQIRAAKQLIEKGVKDGYIAKDYKILAARQLQATQSPGKILYEDIKTWPHWSSAP